MASCSPLRQEADVMECIYWSFFLFYVISTSSFAVSSSFFEPTKLKRLTLRSADPLTRRSAVERNFIRFGRSVPYPGTKTRSKSQLSSHKTNLNKRETYISNDDVTYDQMKPARMDKNTNMLCLFPQDEDPDHMLCVSSQNITNQFYAVAEPPENEPESNRTDVYLRSARAIDEADRIRKSKGGNFMRLGRTKIFNRFDRGHDNFMRLGRSWSTGMDKRKTSNFMRLGRAPQEPFERPLRRYDNFMRLGWAAEENCDLSECQDVDQCRNICKASTQERHTRRYDSFMRLGRSPNPYSRYLRKLDNFMRLGRIPDDLFDRYMKGQVNSISVNSRSAIDDVDKRSRPDNFMRLGRSNNFMRLGRSVTIGCFNGEPNCVDKARYKRGVRPHLTADEFSLTFCNDLLKSYDPSEAYRSSLSIGEIKLRYCKEKFGSSWPYRSRKDEEFARMTRRRGLLLRFGRSVGKCEGYQCSKSVNTAINVHIDSSSRISDCTLKYRRMSTLPKTLTLEEKKYLLAVRNANLPEVKQMIQDAYRHQTIDINCVDSLGRGALNLAIESENLEMVEMLIVMGVEPKDALLHAINEEFVESVELLLEYEEIVYKEGDKYSWEKVDWNTAVFTPDMTPLILAAHKNNFEIIRILLDRGATLPMPHQIGCGCSNCTQESTIDSLRHSMSRVNEYRALASPSLICLSSYDPIMTAFKLSWELRNLARQEKECQKEYTELRRQCQQFAVDLLDQTRNSEELAIILHHEQDQQYNNHSKPNLLHLALLHQAIKYKQKKFIAHAHVQQLLSKIWYDGLPGFRSKSIINKCYEIMCIGVLFPVYCVSYLMFPKSELGHTLKRPIMKFLVHVTSYLLFLGLLILVSQRAEIQVIELLGTEKMKSNLMKALEKQRGNAPSFLEWIVLIYVIGYMKEEMLEIRRIGIEKHIKNSMWNTVELVKNCIYMLVIVLRLYAYVQEQIQIRHDPTTAFIARENWDMFDPQLIAEGWFATANILSALKLIYIFSVNSQLGPLQISLGRMFLDIVKFFLIYALVLFSFACGLNQLLWYYASLEHKKCHLSPNDSESCSKWRYFGNLFESIQTLFWTGFGEIDTSNFDLVGIKPYTRFWGLLMFASYSVLNVTVLLNLLIAMMSNSFSLIWGQADTEWKFARTKLWINCFEEMPTLPSPYNILPGRKFFDKICCRISQINEDKNNNSQENQVMQALVWRYISLKHRSSEMNPVTEDHIQEIKSDISSLKYQIWEVLKKNGMQIPSESKKDKILSKKLRIWERQLMKDFHVGLIIKDNATSSLSEEESTPSPADKHIPRRSNKNSRFKSITKRAASKSPASRWKRTINEVYKASQIGKCRTQESIKKQVELQNAMEKRNVMNVQPSTDSGNSDAICESKLILPSSRPSLLALLKNIQEENKYEHG